MRHLAARGLSAAPDRLMLILFWTSLVVASAVLVGTLLPLVVLPVLVVVLAATWRLMPARLPADRPTLLGAGAALVVAAAWTVAHLPYASRWILVTRDPGFLALEGLWLSKHPAPALPIGSALQVSAQVPDTYVASLAYADVGDVLHAQGAKLLPALLAVAGWVGGERAVLAGNLAIGALALLALYTLARRVVGPSWGLLPVVALAGSMPMGAFSRSSYTEPLTLALAFAGLTMAWSAFESPSWWRYALSGGMVGTASLVRIDGSAIVLGLVAGVGLVAAASFLPRARRRLNTALIVTVVASAATVALGYADLARNSPTYLSHLASEFTLLSAALGLTVVVIMLLALPQWWNPVRTWVLRHRHVLAGSVVALVALIAVALISRPLWDSPHHLAEGSSYAGLVGGLQAAEGLPVDPTRSYDDWSVRWLSWYFGWPMVIAAFAGLAALGHRAISRRDPRPFVVLATIGAPSLLYLWRVSITPDQIWAVRRLLPVTIPGFLLAATVTVVAIWGIGRLWARVVATGLGLAVAVVPFLTWGPMFTVVEQDGRLGELHAVCDALVDERVVFVRVDSPPYLATLRSVCDVEVIEFRHAPSQAELAQVRAAWGGTDLSVTAFHESVIPWGGEPEPLRSMVTTTWPNTLSHRPNEAVRRESHVWVGVIGPDGSVRPTLP